MPFIETASFTRAANRLLTRTDREAVTEALVENPRAGDLIRGTGGLRKMRLAGSGHGKRGGYRVIHALGSKEDVTYLLLIYAKNEVDDLTRAQYKVLASLAED